MSVSFDPGADFADVVDGSESMTLTRRDGTQHDIAGALRRRVRTGEGEPAAGNVAAHDVDWHMPAAAIPSPELGATLTDSAGTEWTILSYSLETFARRLRLRTRNVELAHSLNGFITIQSSALASTPRGAQQIEWTDWRTSVRARTQPVATTREETESQVVAQRSTHVVHLHDLPELSAAHRVIDSSEQIYRIDRIEFAQRLGELTRVFVTRERDGGSDA